MDTARLVAAARAFRTAASELEDAWDGAPSALDGDYPFDRSFDEVAFDIVGWLNEQTLSKLTNQ